MHACGDEIKKKNETTHERHQQQQSPLGHDEKKVVEEGKGSRKKNRIFLLTPCANTHFKPSSSTHAIVIPYT